MAILNQETIIRGWATSFPAGGYYETGRTVEARDNELRGRWGMGVLARFLPAGRKRSRPLFLVTGDEWRAPGWGHSSPQWETRTEVTRAARDIGAEVLLVPFSALAGAGIDLDSIRPLEIRPDRNWNEYEPVPDDIDLEGLAGRGYAVQTTGAEFGAVARGYYSAPARHRTHYWRDRDGRRYERTETIGVWNRYPVEGPRPADWPNYRSWPETLWRHEPLETPHWGTVHRLDRAGTRWGHTVEPDEENPGRWRTVLHRHRLGDSLFLADVVQTRTISRPVSVRDVIAQTLLCIRTERFELERDGRGESAATKLERYDVAEPISETVQVRRRRRFVSSFDANEPRPLYFLATLPYSSRARTVADAIEDLAPAAVHAALARGRAVYRQGDIFTIATNLTDAEIYALAAGRARRSQWTSGARPKRGETGYRPPLDRRTRNEIRAKVRARFVEILRGAVVAAVESGAAYPRTITRPHAAPFESYRPKGPHRRHGAPRHATRDEYRRRFGSNAVAAWNRARDEVAREYRQDRGYTADERETLRRTLSIYGTAHTATEVVRAAGGAVYVRGTMRHEPSLETGRRGGRDHINLKLGDGRTWFLAVRNTVPRTRDTNGRP